MSSWLIGFNGIDLLIVIGTIASIIIVGKDAVRVYREGVSQK